MRCLKTHFIMTGLLVFLGIAVSLCQTNQAQTNIKTPSKSDQDKVPTSPEKPKAPTNGNIPLPTNNNLNRVDLQKEPERDNSNSVEIAAKVLAEKKLLAQSLVSTISGNIANIDPPDLGILIQTELANVLWKTQHTRAKNELSIACERFKNLLKQERDTPLKSPPSMAIRRMRIAIIRNISRLDIKFVHELVELKSLAGSTPKPVIASEWTDEAEAVMTTAMSEIKNNPALAVDLANESLSFGLTSLPNFLNELKDSDLQLAEQEASKFMNKLLSSAVSSLYFMNFRQFIFDPKVSISLRERFFEILAERLELDIRANLTRQEYDDNMIALQSAYQDASGFPAMQSRLSQLASAYQKLTLQPAPDIPPSIAIGQKDTNIVAGDTSRISEAANRAEKNNNTRSRDEEYKRLAIEAAGKADLPLADNLLLQIKDSQLRAAASIKVYSSFTKKAALEKDWLLAKSYALKISEPIGRSLVLDWLIKQIPNQEQNKGIIRIIYSDGLSVLSSDTPSQSIAKGYLIFAKALLPTAKEDCLKALDSAVTTLNASDNIEFFSVKLLAVNEITAWVPRDTSLSKVEDMLDFSQTLENLFYEISKDDKSRAYLMALKLSNTSLGTFARLGIAKQLTEEIDIAKSKDTAPKN